MIRFSCIFMLVSSIAHAGCTVYFNSRALDKPLNDPLYYLLSNSISCPGSLQELKQEMKRNGLKEQISMVANRGRHNPEQGSFSFFESIYGTLLSGKRVEKGSFFLGHFTQLKENQIILDQQPEPGKLLIEAIAWDNQQALYHFYELRGMEHGLTRWFFRGDSMDAYKDNTWLNRKKPDNERQFGNRMRCSACHNSGGPIIKEVASPHNDWWTTKRPLILKPNKPDAEVQDLLDEIVDTGIFSKDVEKGMEQIVKSKKMIRFIKNLSLQEQLRPLFCTNEINLESSSVFSESEVKIPSAFWINPLLGEINLSISSQQYNQLLDDFNMQFPENGLRDADHRWHVPVKGRADIIAIEQLINQNLISQHFAKAVLMVDFSHPLFSAERCDLLKLLPNSINENWLAGFIHLLQKQGTKNNAARLLADYLTDEDGAENKMKREMHLYKQRLIQQLSTYSGLRLAYRQLIHLRKAVYTNEISQNPAGQILEPGFRVIFPESQL